MKAFWWFKPDSIAGMARPGFNSVHWFDLGIEEAVLLGWIGKHSCGTQSLESFREHLRDYAPRIFGFYGLDAAAGAAALREFDTSRGIEAVAERLVSRSEILESFEVADDRVSFRMNPARLDDEIAHLKSRGIDRIVSLTERHHQREPLEPHFGLHHISIEDMTAPKLEQVMELVEVIRAARRDRERLAVHCLAGIGRTSTMLLAAHIVMGEKRDELKRLIRQQNPTYVLTGSQGAFVDSIEERI